MGKRPGAKYAAVQRLDALMANGQKRSEAKAAALARGESLFAFSDGKIRSFQTRTTYQNKVMQFLEWCRDEHDLRDLEKIDVRAEELVSLYLTQRLLEGKSAWTLKTERSAFRLFFQNHDLAESVLLPKRRRQDIKRSRRPAKRDKHFQPANWQPLITFCLACGLRREELRDLLVRDVYHRPGDGQLIVEVRRGKGGKDRKIKVFPGREHAVLAVIEGRDPAAHVFERLPQTDIHAFRRQFAQELYEHLSGRPLPPKEGRLQSKDFDYEAALEVSRRLGHNRVDVIFGSYIR